MPPNMYAIDSCCCCCLAVHWLSGSLVGRLVACLPAAARRVGPYWITRKIYILDYRLVFFISNENNNAGQGAREIGFLGIGLLFSSDIALPCGPGIESERKIGFMVLCL